MSEAPYTTDELMAIVMARLLADSENVFVGISSPLALVASLLARELYAPDLTIISVTGAVNPEPERPPRFSTHPELCARCEAVVSMPEVFDMCVRGELDTVLLRGAQVDASGNLNTSVVGDYERPRVRLPGGAGTAVLMANARRVLSWTPRHEKRVFVERVDFITGTGRLDRVVTPLCVFKMEGGRLAVEALMPGARPEDVVQNTGFEVRFLSQEQVSPPTPEELRALRKLDPDGVRRLELAKRR